MPRMGALMLHPVTFRAFALAACGWLLACDAGALTRLSLEPLDLGIDRDLVLRTSPQLATQLAEDPRQRQAAGALWQVLQREPEHAVQEAQRLQGAERELDALRDAARQNASALAQLRMRIQQAEDGRDAAWLVVLALAAVLAALLAWLALRWHRARQLDRVGRWFEANGENAAQEVPMPAAAASQAAGGVHGDPLEGSRAASIRMVGVEELIDVHDKADFFLSIGETEQAISVLQSHVHDDVETGALAWMDLLELYHSLGRQVDYERVRGEFRQRFAVQVPDFEHFDQPAASLENYNRALSRIVALWPSQRVLEAIEESIFRKPGLPGADAFSLEAYRELVLLYHIAKEMLPADQGTPAGDAPDSVTGFSETGLQPLNALDAGDATDPDPDRERLMIPPASARLGVDIDLEEPSGAHGPTPLDFDVSGHDDVTDVTAADPVRKSG